jgi:phosphopantetheine adenylyltransferase
MSDWPHDPDGEKGSEGMRKYGQAILAKKLDEEADFPLRRDEFVEEYGDHPVRLNHERVVSVAAIMEHVEESEFDEVVEFHKVVGRAMRENGLWEITPQEVGR